MKRPATRRVALALMLIAAAAALAAQFLRADRWAGSIRWRLERTLGRKVEFGAVRLSVFGGPGFVLENVVIHEDPAWGAEPFAYVESLELAVRLTALAGGRVEFSGFRLASPHVNLMRRPGGWNFAAWLERFSNNRSHPLPSVIVRQGRLNFKTGDTKSVFYLSGTDLDLLPASGAGQPAQLRFSGEPARTDRPAEGFGRLRGRGRVGLAAEAELDLDLELERSAISEILVLLGNRDFGIEGFVASRARLAGPVSNLSLTGSIELSDLPRYSWLAPGRRNALQYRARLDLKNGEFELDVPEREGLPVSLRTRTFQSQGVTRWALSLVLRDLPAAALLEPARQTGLRLPEGAVVQGSITGAAVYSPARGLQGRLRLSRIELGSAQTPPLRLAEADIVADRGLIRLLPATWETTQGRNVKIEALWEPEPGGIEWRLEAARMGIDEFRSAWLGLIGVPLPVMLKDCVGGDWRGTLRWVRGETPADPASSGDGLWTGVIDIENSSIPVAGIAQPATLTAARVHLQGRRAEIRRLEAQVGDIEVTGNVRQESTPARTRWEVALPALEWSDFERMLAPTLRRDAGLLARALRRAGLPDWLRDRNAEGVLRLAGLRFGDLQLRDVRCAFRWNGPVLEIRELEADTLDGHLSGTLTADFRDSEPVYQARIGLRNVSWRGGRLDARLSGVLRLRGGKLELRDLEAAIGGETYSGRGAGTADGALELELTGGGKQVRLAGRLSPLELEAAPVR